MKCVFEFEKVNLEKLEELPAAVQDAIAELVNALAREDKPSKIVLTVEGKDVTVDQIRAAVTLLDVQE